MAFPEHVRLLTLELTLALAAFAALARPNCRDQKTAHDALRMQAIELRVEEKENTRTLHIPLPVSIGRGTKATLNVQDAQVSRMHARIGFADGRPVVCDLGSRNGTFVNACLIEGPTALDEGDEIMVGSVRIVVGKLVPWT